MKFLLPTAALLASMALAMPAPETLSTDAAAPTKFNITFWDESDCSGPVAKIITHPNNGTCIEDKEAPNGHQRFFSFKVQDYADCTLTLYTNTGCVGPKAQDGVFQPGKGANGCFPFGGLGGSTAQSALVKLIK